MSQAVLQKSPLTGGFFYTPVSIGLLSDNGNTGSRVKFA